MSAAPCPVRTPRSRYEDPLMARFDIEVEACCACSVPEHLAMPLG
jgi:hypothetical protein